MKIINLVLGLGTAIILTSLVGLGVQTFYPAPEYPEYPETSYPQERQCDFNCAFNDEKCYATEDACYDEQDRLLGEQDKVYGEQLDEYDRQLDAYDEKNEAYDRNYFMIANLVGLLIFLGGILLLFFSTIATRSVAIGIMVAGLASIIGGYATSWWSKPGEGLEFFVGLLVAVIVVAASMWFMHKYHQRDAQSPS